MNARIGDFIEGQKVATVCCMDEENTPYCFSCFFVFDREKALLYFKSSSKAFHSTVLNKSPKVAGTIQPDKLNPLAIKGIQFTGLMINAHEPMASDANTRYHKKYPFALAMPGEVRTIRLHYIKMTDNTLSFGKKIIWQQESVIETK